MHNVGFVNNSIVDDDNDYSLPKTAAAAMAVDADAGIVNFSCKVCDGGIVGDPDFL